MHGQFKAFTFVLALFVILLQACLQHFFIFASSYCIPLKVNTSKVTCKQNGCPTLCSCQHYGQPKRTASTSCGVPLLNGENILNKVAVLNVPQMTARSGFLILRPPAPKHDFFATARRVGAVLSSSWFSARVCLLGPTCPSEMPLQSLYSTPNTFAAIGVRDRFAVSSGTEAG